MDNLSLLEKRIAKVFYGGFSVLYPAQNEAIPIIDSGANLILTAGTGRGKTEAAFVPLISKYYQKAFDTDSTVIVYIVPTKALVNDIYRRLFNKVEAVNLRIGVKHSDRNDMKKVAKPHVLITTPESLEVLLFQNNEAIRHVSAIIIDEVHLLYNTQRGFQLSSELKRLEKFVGAKIQKVAISATVCSHEYIREFFFDRNEPCEYIKDCSPKPIDAQIRHIECLDDLSSLLERIIRKSSGKYLLFANSRKECELIAESLSQNDFLKNITMTHYSSLSQDLREEVEKRFNDASSAMCISTSTLELGIDIGNIDAVFLYGPPAGVESFLQRIGRGNRRTNKTNVICLVRPNAERPVFEALIFHALVDLAQNGTLPEKKPFELYGAICQQVFSMIGSQGGQYIRTAEIMEIFEKEKHINKENFELILGELTQLNYVKKHGFKNRYGGTERLYDIIDNHLHYGNFPMSSVELKIFHGKKLLGYIPQYNYLKIHKNDHIRFAGKLWKVKKISLWQIDVEESSSEKPAVNIFYNTPAAEADGYVLSRISEIINSEKINDKLYTRKLYSILNLFLSSIKCFYKPDTLFYSKTIKEYCYLTFAGKNINEAVALASKQSDYSVSDTKIICSKPIDWQKISTDPLSYEPFFDRMFESNKNQTFFQTLLPDSFQLYERVQDWLKNSSVEIILKKLKNSNWQEILFEQIKSWNL